MSETHNVNTKENTDFSKLAKKDLLSCIATLEDMIERNAFKDEYVAAYQLRLGRMREELESRRMRTKR